MLDDIYIINYSLILHFFLFFLLVKISPGISHIVNLFCSNISYIKATLCLQGNFFLVQLQHSVGSEFELIKNKVS